MDSTNLELVIGKPTDKVSATCTRFTLPFAYRLSEIENTEEDLFFEIDPASDLSFIKRRKYFSREAALVLYNRATWLTLCKNWDETVFGKDGVIVNLRDNTFTIKMLPPKIILFEAEECKLQKQPNILQTGFLSLDIYFPEQENKPILDDLLSLNELFRYFGIPWDKHAKSYNEALGKVPVEYNLDKNPRCVKDLIQFNDQDELKAGFKEAYFSRWENLLGIPIVKDGKSYKLFPEQWSTDAKKWAYNIYKSPLDEHWQVYADNRSYVWTAAILKNGAESLIKQFDSKKQWQAHQHGHWVKLLNVDSPAKSPAKTHASRTEFESNWADERTYKRWEEDGTWYGYSYHCGAMIGAQNGVFGLQYFDASVLLFYARITLFRFNTKLSSTLNDSHPSSLLSDNKKIHKQFKQLRSEFSFFSILYQTPLLSNQQQSLEMYEYNKKYFEIDELFNDVKREIDETHDLLEQMEAISLGKTANFIARWGIPFAAGGLVTGLFGMSDFNLLEKCVGNNCFSWVNIFAQSGVVMMITILAFWLVSSFKKGDKK